METAKREVNYLDVAEQLIGALRQQETRTKALEREFAAQRELNSDLVTRIQRLEQEKKELEDTIKKQQETKQQKQEQKADPKQDNSKLDEEIRRMFGPHIYDSPNVLLWVLGRD